MPSQGFHSFCHHVLHRKLFTKIPSLPLTLGVVCFQPSAPYPQIHDQRWRSEQRPTTLASSQVFNLSFCHNSAQSSRRTVVALQSVYQSPCSVVLSFVTGECHQVLHLHLLAAYLQYSLPWVSGEAYFGLFSADFLFCLVPHRIKPTKCILQALLRNC